MQITRPNVLGVVAWAALTIIALPRVLAAQQEDTAVLYAFTAADIAFLKTFSLDSLSLPPSAPGNRYADSIAIAKFGKTLFFDQRLSKDEKFSCASCHQPEHYFTDGLPLGQAHGTARRSTPTLLGTAWSPWQYWDGRKDSLWSQALAPIEHADEMALDRTAFAKTLAKYHGDDYQAVFGKDWRISRLVEIDVNASPRGSVAAQKNWQKLARDSRRQINRLFVNAGKALMAYQRQLRIPLARFDHFVAALGRAKTATSADAELASIMTANEVRGMRLFMGKANCASCHNGPLFTNFEFHNIGAPEPDETAVDLGRYAGVKALIDDEFTCLSEWSDAGPGQCEEMRFLKRSGSELVGAFKTPTLRNIVHTGPYMQAGQFATLNAVLMHYNLPNPPFYDREQHPNRPHFDILPLQLDEAEQAAIIAFLNTLTSPYPNDDFWWNQSVK